MLKEENSPVEGFSSEDIIKKFHWLQDSGMDLDQAVEHIKDQTDDVVAIRYINAYQSAVSKH